MARHQESASPGAARCVLCHQDEETKMGERAAEVSAGSLSLPPSPRNLCNYGRQRAGLSRQPPRYPSPSHRLCDMTGDEAGQSGRQLAPHGRSPRLLWRLASDCAHSLLPPLISLPSRILLQPQRQTSRHLPICAREPAQTLSVLVVQVCVLLYIGMMSIPVSPVS
ncbi:hypothetical protein B0H63DRAFT_136343 [Podospora didyma]|uniref:Uncharacterized protein n=1 Tax=Podospora didyma TaxID=330526 RepID=A0AAE0NRM3_9PEZI|nr:hypothetical protein B0H63DRAFT_136343 [Podospora didyma]